MLYLLSFYNQKFKAANRWLRNSAGSFGLQQGFHFSHEAFRRTEFYHRNAAITSEPFGAGFYLWKPYYLLEVLHQLKEGEVVCYVDSGHSFVADPSPLFKLCQEHPIVLFENYQGYPFFSNTHLPFSEYNCYEEVNKCRYWCKADSYSIMGLDEEGAREAWMVDASMLLVRKTSATVKLVEEWLSWCTDRRLISWDANESGQANPEGFQFHVYDQSVLSLLAYKYKLPLFRCPSQYGNHYKMEQWRVANEYLLLPYAARPHLASDYDTITHHHRYKPHSFSWRLKQYLYREAMLLPDWFQGMVPKSLETRKGFY